MTLGPSASLVQVIGNPITNPVVVGSVEVIAIQSVYNDGSIPTVGGDVFVAVIYVYVLFQRARLKNCVTDIFLVLAQPLL